MMPGKQPEPVAFHPEMPRLPPIFERLIGPENDPGVPLLLIAGAGARRSGWAGAAATALAGLIGERGRHVILADLALDEPELHKSLGQPNDEGVTDMLLFGASLNYVARRAPESAFHFAPAGAYAAEPHTVFEHGRWDDMLRGAKSDNALLLLYVPAEIEGVDAISRRVRRAVLLASDPEEVRETIARLAGDCRVDAALVPGGDLPDAAMDIEDDGVQDPVPSVPKSDLAAPDEVPLDEETLIQELAMMGRRPRRRWGRFMAVVILLGVLGAGGWFAYDEYGFNFNEYLALLDRPEATAADGETAETSLQGARPIDTLLPYSVVIASYDALDVATERVAALRDDFGYNVAFYVAPVIVDGEEYYRLLAGPSAAVGTAQALMRRLVEMDVKETEQPWAVRNTAWAYHLGDFSSRDAATARQRELRGMDIPNYLIEVPYTAGPSRYRLYAGAYAGAAEAEVMAGMLEASGIQAPLVRRVGRPVR